MLRLRGYTRQRRTIGHEILYNATTCIQGSMDRPFLCGSVSSDDASGRVCDVYSVGVSVSATGTRRTNLLRQTERSATAHE